MIRRTLTTLALLGALTVPLGAQAAPALKVQEASLPNGLKILMVENHKVPVFSLQMWYKVGSRNERPGITGLSHLLEHLHYLGTKRRPTGQYDREVETQGGGDNASTSEDYTDYYVEMASPNLERAIDLEADALANLAIPANKFESEKRVVMEERRLRTENSPFGMMFELMGATAYVAHPYSWPVVGWMSDLIGMTRQDAWTYYQTYYKPNNATLVLVGDFDPKQALQLIRKHFGPIKAGPTPPPVRTVEPPQNGEHRTELIKEVETPAVMAAFKIPAVGHPDLYALMVAANVLARGESSRLYRKLVDQTQIAQSVEASANEQRDPGLFILAALPTPGHTTQELETAMYQELDRLKTEPVSEQELSKAKKQIESDFLMGQQRASTLGFQLGMYETLKDYHLFLNHVPQIRHVTAEEVQRVAKTYFLKANRSVVTLVPKEAHP
ncbi:MAG TPA: pitrilysin family protein [Stenomitos sp.]